MHNLRENKLDFCDVLITPKHTNVSSRKEIDLNVSYNLKNSKVVLNGIPIFASNMDGVGNMGICCALAKSKIFTCLTKRNTIQILENGFNKDHHFAMDYCIGTFGLDESSKFAIDSYDLTDSFEVICLDVANGYMSKFCDLIKYVRDKYPTIGIIAGNVVTPEGVVAIAESGADIVKIGIGSGSVCTTRRVAGVGYPQFSAILDCKQACRESGVLLMSDGGCLHPGDVGKAFGAGADTVMLGGMLAGHEEGLEGGTLFDDGEKRKFVFSGSSSSKALSNNGGINSYRTSEGRVVVMDIKGSVSDSINHILGGLRSTCSYSGCFKLSSFISNASFIKVNRQLNEHFEHHTVSH